MAPAIHSKLRCYPDLYQAEEKMRVKNIQIIVGALTLLIVLILVTNGLPDSKANSIIKNVLRKYDQSKNIKSDYKQVFYWKLTDNIAEQQGVIWLQGKEKFRIETENQTIVSDGKTLWTYSRATGQVIVDNVQNSEDINLPKDILLNFSDEYRASYISDELIDKDKCHLIELRPSSGDQFIKLIKIWIHIKDMIVIKIEQTDLNDNTNTYWLSNIEFNLPLKDSFFKYVVPDSVEVIDMR
ncbi:MAG TPA: outer membrane lipoprotein carrier protein LolA [bacterium]|nr:outer membrane lipoprotein carrier protein LolA [bacterium]